MADTHVVTLGDASITREDLALLMPPAWLNDRLLSFWFEHMRLHRAENDPRVALLGPSVAYLLSVVDAETLPELLRELRLDRAAVVLVALNSAAAAGAAGAARHAASSTAVGSHWTLLVFRRNAQAFLHYDSAPGHANARAADVAEVPVPRQRNSYDCGAYVCLFAERIVRRFMAGAKADAAEAAIEAEPFDDEAAGDGVVGDEDAERLATLVSKKRQEIGVVVSLVLHEQQMKKQLQQRHDAA